MTNRLLLVFVRTPKLGKVKTRLARTVGDAKALQVYEALLQHTHAVAARVAAEKWVCYADEVPEHDAWSDRGFVRQQQPPGDLGTRMLSLFALGLLEGYSSILVIGSDCPGLSSEILEEAFQKLEQPSCDLVMGPAQDGGYYLLGLKCLHPELFLEKPWSTSEVQAATLATALELQLNVALLPTLSDIDVEEDLTQWPSLLPTAPQG
ncbi:TIGR04282 family arsenosugar biosynthesis glycosyltransferase [Rufibacter quisquiliarum]|uniref:Glycosyltransferase n=1 Tax=Rufibacter quisquiliarum TaxID=1549639 RepID=A0A839GNH9_9BACT|nr:TIGR04282 family arsenosugar biosynthesis glycosyltransferase [Rufibacter quisquiliarum]MBA9076477.1 hypothetical protein [Rufibacter quisquiliarum]